MLSNLVFSDLFVSEDAETSWFKSTPDSLVTNPIPLECVEELAALRSELDKSEKSSFGLNWPSPSGIRMRVERIQVATSKVIYVCRRFRLAPGTLASLGMPLNVADKLLSPELTEGLVIFLGKAGAGKTTTAFSFLIERLSLFGGVCFTIENPIELQVEGKHGKGRLYQSQVTSDTAIGPAIQDRLRGSPNIFFIGELRDGLAIREAITAATSGHLVVATFHSADLLTGIARLVRLAGDNNASSAVADALRVAIHLSLHNLDPNKQLPELITTPNPKGTGTPARVLSVEPLWMTGQTSDGLKSMLRDGDVHLLKSELERQRRSFLMSKLP